jgi:SpoVK/Ycf46/Vps4 family AAA+-type ATPase
MTAEQGACNPCGPTFQQLRAGAYAGAKEWGENRIQIVAKDLKTDDLLDFPSSLSWTLLQEIELFWTLGDQFRRFGYLHKRGYLFYGPQGSGKSSLVQQIVRQIIQAGHVAFFCDDPEVFVRAMELFRTIEPSRPAVCVFEDIDTIIDKEGESEILQWLDGAQQIDRVVNIATTNYPEKLDRRLVSRARRFDRIVKVDGAAPEIREAYLGQKLPHLGQDDLAQWVKKTSGLSFAALAELVISVACLGKDLDETVALLKEMEGNQLSSQEFERRSPLGFGSRDNHCPAETNGDD